MRLRGTSSPVLLLHSPGRRAGLAVVRVYSAVVARRNNVLLTLQGGLPYPSWNTTYACYVKGLAIHQEGRGASSP